MLVPTYTHIGIHMPITDLAWPGLYNQIKKNTQDITRNFLEKKYKETQVWEWVSKDTKSARAKKKDKIEISAAKLILLRYFARVLDSILMCRAAFWTCVLERASWRYTGITSLVQSPRTRPRVTIPGSADVFGTTQLHKACPYGLRIGPLQVGEWRWAGRMASLRLAVGRGAVGVRE